MPDSRLADFDVPSYACGSLDDHDTRTKNVDGLSYSRSLTALDRKKIQELSSAAESQIWKTSETCLRNMMLRAENRRIGPLNS